MLSTHPMEDILDIALRKGLSGEGLDFEEGLRITELGDERLFDILAISERIRAHHRGREVILCSIINAKSGLCGEDCSFCAQSVHYSTGVRTYPMVEPGSIVRAAEDALRRGAREFSIVTSGRGIEREKELHILEEAIKGMREGLPIERCASLGIVKKDTLERLKEAGLQSYHHNLETSRSFFPNVCTTHDYEEDVKTIRYAKEAGLHVCCGGVFGIGENWYHRVELAVTLRELDVDSIPINFLNPRPGTPLEGGSNLTPIECLRIIALYRFMLPAKDIIICGGRELNLRDLQCLIFAAGASGMMVGGYLTTKGREPEKDLLMLRDLGLSPRK